MKSVKDEKLPKKTKFSPEDFTLLAETVKKYAKKDVAIDQSVSTNQKS